MDKDYLEKQYEQAVREFKTAKTEDEQWDARQTMARLERTAMATFGNQYADELHEKMLGKKPTEQTQTKIKTRDFCSWSFDH